MSFKSPYTFIVRNFTHLKELLLNNQIQLQWNSIKTAFDNLSDNLACFQHRTAI